MSRDASMGGSMTQQGYTDFDVTDSRAPKMPEAPDTGELLEIRPAAVGLDTPVPEVVVAPEGHILLILPAGEVVTGSMATAAAEQVQQLAGTRKVPMLLVLTGIEALTRAARTVFSKAASLEAVAVLGVSPVDRVIATFLLGGITQPCPTKYFSTETEALAWLKRRDALV